MKISFDFDSTLDNNIVQNFAKKLIEEGHEVWVVTSRVSERLGHPSWNTDLLDVTVDIGIKSKNIYFTEGSDKYIFLKNNNFDVHLDDDVIELSLIEAHTNCLPVCHLNWGEKYGGKDRWKQLILEFIKE